MKKQIAALSLATGLMVSVVSNVYALATLNVDGKVLSTSCDVSVMKAPSVSLRAAVSDWAAHSIGSIAFGNPSSNTNNSTPSDLSITACTAHAGVTPYITVKGDTIAGQDKLFANQPDAQVAIIVSKTPVAAGIATTGNQYLKNGDELEVATSSGASLAEAQIPLYVGMVQATAIPPVAGDHVTASINFVYDER